MGYWIVVVDDEPLSLTNAKTLLREQNMRVSCLRSGSDFLEFIENHTPDLILLDIFMPDMDGFETYRALRRFEEKTGRAQLPVIFLTGEDNSEAERRGLKAGASDFIHKPFDRDILIKRINNTIINSKTIESLTEEATLDKLTGFLNKASGTKRVSGLCEKSPGALMIMDLDSFKLVNDLFGHDMGDRILVAFSEIVRLNVRSEDVISRIGGDEFMGYFTDLTKEEAVASLSQRLNAQLLKEAEVLMGEDHGIPLGVSIGVAFSSQEWSNDYQTLFQNADSALYDTKRNGKHGYTVYDPDGPEETTEDDLELEMSRIIQVMSERGEANGAFLLGQEAFSWSYRFILRFLTRYGGVVARILFSLSSPEKGKMFTEAVTEFGNVLKNTLRRSDIVHQWRQNRYFVVLTMLSHEDIEEVISRILTSFKDSGYADRVDIKYTSSLIRKDCYESKE
ncbi:MAG: diguanylate cyclase [Lachnospiraceae bacterium]|nr:diguanylate cyclase [Lachnospiraceae bacterium]